LAIAAIYAVLAIALMDLKKEQDTILYAKFLTRVDNSR